LGTVAETAVHTEAVAHAMTPLPETMEALVKTSHSAMTKARFTETNSNAVT
jgi:hypothetical protein